MIRDRLQAVASTIGVDARPALRPGAHGTVIAAFRRSVYVRLPDGIACIGDARIGAGPLNILCDGARWQDWCDVAEAGGQVEIACNLLQLPGASVALASAETWSPSPPPSTDAAALAAGLAALGGALPIGLPTGGLGVLIAPGGGGEGGIAEVAALAGARLATWLGDGTAREAAIPEGAIRALLGLGPGLTPSGDDYLAGFAVAVRMLGARRHHARLAAKISALCHEYTNEISAVHLAAALRGRLRADLHLVIHAVLSGDRPAIARGIRHLAAEDHHSPWDALAGFAAAARACPASVGSAA